MIDLAVFQLSGCVNPKDFPETLGNLVNLRILELSHCVVLEGFGEALGTSEISVPRKIIVYDFTLLSRS